MGIDDYVLDYDYLKTKQKSILSEYKFPKGTNDYIKMTTKIEDESHEVVNSQVTLKYEPADSDIVITDDTDQYDSFSISGHVVTIVGAAERSTVYITYDTTLEEVETTDGVTIKLTKDSFVLRRSKSTEAVPYNEFVDILFDQKRVKLQPNALITTDTTDTTYIIYMAFDYEVQTNEKYKTYKTNVLYTKETEIDILPFTDDEVDAGNAHIIDNIVISKKTKFTMTPGWHAIQTTQAIPSNTSAARDVNKLTGEASDAGIILKGFDKMRAYRNTMRYVTAHRLSNIVPYTDHRAFSIDSNKILVNFQPDVMWDATMDGDVLMGRKATYVDRAVNTYAVNQSKFEILVVLKPTADNTTDKVQNIKYKVELKRSLTSTSPIVTKLEFYGA
jgi:hypothetical protein